MTLGVLRKNEAASSSLVALHRLVQVLSLRKSVFYFMKLLQGAAGHENPNFRCQLGDCRVMAGSTLHCRTGEPAPEMPSADVSLFHQLSDQLSRYNIQYAPFHLGFAHRSPRLS